MATTTTTIDTLNSLLRGELSAIETYEQALAKDSDSLSPGELRRIHDEHRQAATILQEHVQQHGGQPERSSGAWGSFATAVEGIAKLFGNTAALKALKEGEEHGIKEYREALTQKELPNDCAVLIESKLLPKAIAHVPALDRLMAAV